MAVGRERADSKSAGKGASKLFISRVLEYQKANIEVQYIRTSRSSNTRGHLYKSWWLIQLFPLLPLLLLFAIRWLKNWTFLKVRRETEKQRLENESLWEDLVKFDFSLQFNWCSLDQIGTVCQASPAYCVFDLQLDAFFLLITLD